MIKAYVFFNISVASRSIYGLQRLESVIQKMTPDQTVKAEHLTLKYLESKFEEYL